MSYAQQPHPPGHAAPPPPRPGTVTAGATMAIIGGILACAFGALLIRFATPASPLDPADSSTEAAVAIQRLGIALAVLGVPVFIFGILAARRKFWAVIALSVCGAIYLITLAFFSFQGPGGDTFAILWCLASIALLLSGRSWYRASLVPGAPITAGTYAPAGPTPVNLYSPGAPITPDAYMPAGPPPVVPYGPPASLAPPRAVIAGAVMAMLTGLAMATASFVMAALGRGLQIPNLPHTVMLPMAALFILMGVGAVRGYIACVAVLLVMNLAIGVVVAIAAPYLDVGVSSHMQLFGLVWPAVSIALLASQFKWFAARRRAR